jgi:hypothetical protein
LRKFNLNHQQSYLIVNPNNLMTRIQPAGELLFIEETWEKISREYEHAIYFKALTDAQAQADLIQDAGITHLLTSQKGVGLTVDLCPSLHPLDRNLFVELIQTFSKEQKPIPLGVAVSGLWLEKHPDDLAWLLELEQKEEIVVTWINHTYHHPVGNKLKTKFLLGEKIDIKRKSCKPKPRCLKTVSPPPSFSGFPA